MAIPKLPMYEMPTESEVFAMMEAAKKKESEAANTNNEHLTDPFWFPGQKKLGSGPYTVNSMQGAVKVPKANLQGKNYNIFHEDALTDWQTILRRLKDKAKTVKTGSPKTDPFGTVTVEIGGKTVSAAKVAEQLKALRKTSVTDKSGKTETTTEELGVPFKTQGKTNTLPDKSGAVKVKEPGKEWGNNKEKKLDFFDQKNVKTYTTDGKVVTGEFPANKPVKLHDNSGAVKVPKAKL